MPQPPPAYPSLDPHGSDDAKQPEQDLKHDLALLNTATPCPTCSTSTPTLNAFLNDESIQHDLQALTAALDRASAEGYCRKCAAKDAIQTLTTLLFDVKAATKSVRRTREDKKALKAEAKGVAKEFRQEIKAAWRAAKAK